MKKQYLAPEFNIILFESTDVITHSLATSNGDNHVDASSKPGWGWGDESIFTPWGDGGNY